MYIYYKRMQAISFKNKYLKLGACTRQSVPPQKYLEEKIMNKNNTIQR